MLVRKIKITSSIGKNIALHLSHTHTLYAVPSKLHARLLSPLEEICYIQ